MPLQMAQDGSLSRERERRANKPS
ncbi:hypothetical protein CBM2609_A50109 [Cupriavidus taiwanensis]|uniref:Uncharacterized protein n=1 Tax=Cupriavidus taiwanensis TaxID=164546 RepID=A0A976AYP2_9BURK|nr:hypothetical protein CBM2604_A40110 [Cupriavidus taiwanensis]SOZ27176.1 hypothetical protein CBM2609_A50109 [Cupriavidus taiwanensis]SOZ45669.1 hypothetical protein CBM2610_A60110 [Cupriavidus taiwanensis]SOZ60307.1 hypothetical protein CBM2615_A70055 [Cupriavidus taiwanensis]SOZ60368.1 hypothetical protein CBM2614_A60183 [Cupriavidus taiwanensis]